MDIMTILALVEKGVTVVSALIEAGKEAGPAITVIKNLITGAQNGTVTQAEMDAVETQLDAMVAEFNDDLPED